MFSGSIPALVTPFRDGSFDESAYRSFIDWQIEEGSSALVPCGTTGEAATQAFHERFEVVRVCIDQADGHVPVIAGCGSNDTQSAIKNLKKAQELGATAGLVVPPYYSKPSQEGIYRHFEAIIAACDLPIILYNVPGRTASDIAVETMQRLRKFQSVIGVKDATADMNRVSAQRAVCAPDFCQLSGNDYLTLGYLAMGGTGCISVTANVAPRLCAEFQAAWARGDTAEALALNDRLYPLHSAMFADASPGPAKYALTRVRPGFPAELRLPMTWPSAAAQAIIDSALGHAGLLED